MTTVSLRLAAPLTAVLLILGGCTGDPPPSGEAADSVATAAPGTDIYVAPLDTTGDSLRLGAPTPLTKRPGYDNQPAFLPDGTGLVWTAIRDGQADVYRRGRGDEGPPERVTNTPESEFSPTPRPDDRMTLVRVEEDGRQRLWTYRLDGTPVEPVLPSADSVGYHAWLDSTRAALFVLGTPPALRVVNVETGADTVVARRIGRSLQPVPGRAAVSFVQVGPDSTTTVHVLDGAALATRQLTTTPENDPNGDHAWTPGGRLLMATDDALVAWRRGGDGWQTVAALDTLTVSRLAVSPSADRLAMVGAE
jgi:Tol biopolymer transport system component